MHDSEYSRILYQSVAFCSCIYERPEGLLKQTKIKIKSILKNKKIEVKIKIQSTIMAGEKNH